MNEAIEPAKFRVQLNVNPDVTFGLVWENVPSRHEPDYYETLEAAWDFVRADCVDMEWGIEEYRVMQGSKEYRSPPKAFELDLTDTEQEFFDGFVEATAEAAMKKMYAETIRSDPRDGVFPIDGEKPANPKQAFGDKKLATQCVPPALLLGAAKAFGEGAKKYGAFNWRESKVEAMTYVGALLRHAMAYLDGEDVDPESTTGKLHLEGIAACAGILLDCTYGGFLIDNRPPKGPAPEMVRTPK